MIAVWRSECLRALSVYLCELWFLCHSLLFIWFRNITHTLITSHLHRFHLHISGLLFKTTQETTFTSHCIRNTSTPVHSCNYPIRSKSNIRMGGGHDLSDFDRSMVLGATQNNNSVQPWWVEKHLRMYSILNLEVDGVSDQKTTLDVDSRKVYMHASLVIALRIIYIFLE